MDFAYYLAGYPHPYSVNKFLVFIDIGEVLRCKIVILLELFAESSFQKSYRVFEAYFSAKERPVAGFWLKTRRSCSHEFAVSSSLIRLCAGRRIFSAKRGGEKSVVSQV